MVRLVKWFLNLFKRKKEVRHFEGLPSDNIWVCPECASWNSPWRIDCGGCKTKYK